MKTTEALAREAGIVIDPRFGLASTGNVQLARFEALVRADEREKCALLCDRLAAESAEAYRVTGSPPSEYVKNGKAECAAAIRSSKPQEG